MAKKKIKVGELTLNKIVEIAEKGKESCTRCPLYPVPHINCYHFCEENEEYIKELKERFKEEIEVEEDE